MDFQENGPIENSIYNLCRDGIIDNSVSCPRIYSTYSVICVC